MNVCGDGKRSTNEECDDGNLNDGDGCSQNCLVEEKFHCTEENKCTISFFRFGENWKIVGQGSSSL